MLVAILTALAAFLPGVTVTVGDANGCTGMATRAAIIISSDCEGAALLDLFDHEVCHILTGTTADAVGLPASEWHGPAWAACYAAHPVRALVE